MKQKKIRYAVVGLGHIAQVAMLPAFKHAKKNSELVALVSDDPKKLKVLSKKYGAKLCYDYTNYDELLDSKQIDAVYIATPNTFHRQFAEPAIQRGIHVLCEKPIATNVSDCLALQKMLENSPSKFMTAYRLHFNSANLEAVKIAKSGKLGELRVFNSLFCNPVKDPNNIRLKKETGGGPLYDIGIYCINATRYLFQAEPYEVFATKMTGKDKKFDEVEEMISAVMKFPEDRIATFTCSFGASDIADYELAGTKGSLKLEKAYEYAAPMKLSVTKDGKTSTKKYPKQDQFAAELLYFSDCILKDKTPEPGIVEGLVDVEIMSAIMRSCDLAQTVTLRIDQKEDRPTIKQKISRPGTQEPKTVNVTSPSRS